MLLSEQGHSMDINVRAFRVVQQATSDNPITDNSKKDAARKGGLAGGPSRAKAISRERRVEIARKASAARWSKRKATR